MKKIILILLVVGLVGVSGAFAQYKPMLVANGVTLEAPAGSPYIFSHETSGNKVIVYLASNPSEVKVKMIDNDGNTVWDHTSDTGGSPYYTPVGCETSNGNIIVAWGEGKSPSAIYAEKLIPSGSNVSSDWVTRVSTQTTTVRYPRVAPDSNDGAYVGFDHYENSKYYVFAQHLSSTGPAWSSDLLLTYYERDYGLKLIAGTDGRGLYVFYNPAPIGDFTALYLVTNEGTTGTVVGSKSLVSNGTGFDVVKTGDHYYTVQHDTSDNIRIYKNTSDLSDVNNAVVCNETGTQEFPKIVADADPNGANLYVCWNDYRSGQRSNVDVYAQKLNSSLVPDLQWTANGELVSKTSGANVYAYMYTNGTITSSYAPMAHYNGDTYIAFQNYNPALSSWDDIKGTTEADIYMQVLDSNGTTLTNDLPICSIINYQFSPEIRTSTPFIAWNDYRTNSYLQMNGQRVDKIDTQITGITISPASSNMVINGLGFGADPRGYRYDPIAYGAEYNHVSRNGVRSDILEWRRTGITFDNYTYNDFLAGSNNDATIEVMAYGDSDSFTISKPSNVNISDIYFDGVAYTSGMVIKSNTLVTGAAESYYDITSASIDVDGSPSTLTVTNGAFSHQLSALSSGNHTIIISATDSEGGTGSTTCNVSVSSVITITDVKFGSEAYVEGDSVTGNTSFSCTIQSDYEIGSEIYISSGTGTGTEINVSTNYNPTTQVLNIPDLGVHITLMDEITFTLKAKDANGNVAIETFEVKNPETVQAENVIAQPPESPSDDIIIAANIGGADLGGSGVSGAQAAATSQSVQIIIYGPAGHPVSINRPVTVGYNEFRIPAASVINSNGIYIVKIVYKGKVIAKTRFVVLW